MLANLCNLFYAFDLYKNLSGQMVNWAKSFIYFGDSVLVAHPQSLQGLLDKGKLPFSYLSVHLFNGHPTIAHLKPLAN